MNIQRYRLNEKKFRSDKCLSEPVYSINEVRKIELETRKKAFAESDEQRKRAFNVICKLMQDDEREMVFHYYRNWTNNVKKGLIIYNKKRRIF